MKKTTIENKYRKFIFLLALICFSPAVWSQGLTEYEQAVEDEFQSRIFFEPKQIQWENVIHSFSYVMNSPDGKKCMIVDVDSGEKNEAFNFNTLATSLEKASGEKVDPRADFFQRLRFTDKSTIQYNAIGKRWQTDLNTSTTHSIPNLSGRNFQNFSFGAPSFSDGNIRRYSPDSTYIAYIRNFNVFVKSVADTSRVFQLSFDGSPADFYVGNSLMWSPDSRALFARRTRLGYNRQVNFVESSPSSQLQPILHTRSYVKPGDVVAQSAPVIFRMDTRKQLDVGGLDISNQYSLSNFEWCKDSRAVTFEYNQRGHQKYQVIEMNAATGGLRAVVDEEVNTFFIYNPIYGKKFRYDVQDGSEIIWLSERDGWNHLYLFDGKTGQVKNQITKGEWVVRKVIHVDEKNRTILFAAGGYNAGQDPYFLQIFRVNFDGTGLKQLTTENANHETVFSPDFHFFIDKYSRIDTVPVTVLRRSEDGQVVKILEKTNIDKLLATGWKFPEVFTAKGRDGVTDIWGMIIRPKNFDTKKKYPVIEYIYAGPHDSFVPKSFTPNPKVGMVGLANLGFILVQIDGMGTSNRSKKFHDVAFKNLKDAGFPDRIAWMKKAASKYPYMDLSRVGIYGRSAGGQESSAALLFHPEFYKVAVSVNGCHDNRMDKLWWNEQFMGYPVGVEYEESSNVVNAYRLQGNLMLQLSEMDTNVDPSSTIQFVNALINAKKDFEFVMLPGQDHHEGGDFGEMKRREFFVNHLLNKKSSEMTNHYFNTMNK